MSSKKKNNFEKKILELLKKNKQGMTQKELSQALDVHKSTYHAFSDSLSGLVKKQSVYKNRKSKKFMVSRSHKKLIGELRINKGGFGFVHDENKNIDVFIGRDHLNTAFDLDIVEVMLYAKSKGKNEEGFVSKILERKRVNFVGTFHETEYYNYVVPDDLRVYRDFFVPNEFRKNARNGQKVAVRLIRWERDHLNPEAEIIDILGYPGEKGVDVSSIAYSYQIEEKFSNKIEQEAAAISNQIPDEEIEGRLDLRKELCFTIDPEDAKDFDDAVSLAKLPNGNWELGVHIADVSYYVKENSEIDKEAYKRGTSVYLVDRVIPMLPEKLSNNICSLRPREDRLTYSCIMEIDNKLEITAYRIKPSVINSNHRFTYEEVQNIYDSGQENEFSEIIKNMMTLGKQLTTKRLESGGIDFETPEVTFDLDDKGFPVGIRRKNRLDSHRLIEEFMLLANKTVAAHISTLGGERTKPPFIYRVHEKPDQEKMTRFFEFLKALGIKVTPVANMSSSEFQELLKSLKGTKEEIVIEEVALRSMMKAAYSPTNIGHFGLGFKDYTHFTSPIRRYPDLIVHRILKKYDSDQFGSVKPDLIRKICDKTSKAERNAIEAERDSIKLKQTEFISKHVGEEFEGIISGVMSFGVFVEIIENLVEGLIHISEIADDYYIYDEKSFSMIGKETNRRLRLGDVVKIRVERVNLEAGKVDFKLVD